VLAGL